MRNIFIFIRRHFNFVLFILLQITCIVLLVKNSDTHQAAYANIANEVVGNVNTQYDKVHSFFNLKENNRLLLEENNRLKNMLGTNFDNADTNFVKHIDSISEDTTGKLRKYWWLPAKVVNNTVSMPYNFMTIHRGTLQGVKKDMAVIGPQGVAGTVVDVSENFCRAMSLLHPDNVVSAMLKKSKMPGKVKWEGKDPRFLTLSDIPKSTQVFKGDTVVTSLYSSKFPPGQVIGYVVSVKPDPVTNAYIITVSAATNFYSLEYVNLVENLQLDEQRRLEAVKLKNE